MYLKEYRICMPLTVEEYRLGQLFMIAKHSNEQSQKGEGVEVVTNEPCEHEEYGKGQFTEKRIHLSSKLPTWIRSMIPAIFYITEKAWNYYPHTITEYTCSFIPKFSVHITTKYEDNNGTTENFSSILSSDISLETSIQHISNNISLDRIGQECNKIFQTVEFMFLLMDFTMFKSRLLLIRQKQFLYKSKDYLAMIPFMHLQQASLEICLNLSEEELAVREVDFIDIVNDPIDEAKYKEEEDLTKCKSKKTGRGPLNKEWRDSSQPIMCSYKVVRCFFEVWGLQTKVEGHAQQTCRDVNLLGHRQAISWMDDWIDMTLDDIRQYEGKLQKETNEKVLQDIGTLPPTEEVQIDS